MSSVHMPEHVKGGLDPPYLLEQPLAAQPAVLGYIEMPLWWIMRDQHINIIRYGITPGILSTDILERKLLATALWYLRGTVDLECAIPGESQRD